MELVTAFLKRSILAFIGVPLVVIAAWFGGWWMAALLILLSLPALGEYYAGVQQHGGRPASAVGYLSTVALLIAVVFTSDADRDRVTLLILFLALMAVFLVSFDRRNYRGMVYDTAVTIFGLVYIAVMMTFFVRLRDLNLPAHMGVAPVFLGGNVSSVLLVLLPAWALDTVAYAVGRGWGSRRLAPALSPGKTVEGAVAGFLAAVLVTLIVGAWWNHLPWTHSLALGCLIGIFAQIGDLAESVLKRDLGLKDFGTLFGPHGGVLDRFDDILFVMPLAYFYLWFMFMT